jgi:hypothetical protein
MAGTRFYVGAQALLTSESSCGPTSGGHGTLACSAGGLYPCAPGGPRALYSIRHCSINTLASSKGLVGLSVEQLVAQSILGEFDVSVLAGGASVRTSWPCVQHTMWHTWPFGATKKGTCELASPWYGFGSGGRLRTADLWVMSPQEGVCSNLWHRS